LCQFYAERNLFGDTLFLLHRRLITITQTIQTTIKRNTLIHSLSALALGGALLVGCKDDASTGNNTSQPQLANRSVTPALVKDVMSGVQVFTLISSDDQIPAPAGDNKQYVFGGAADGAGFLRNSDGTYTLLTEHEDNYAVSRLKLDKDLKPLTLDYVMTSSQGNWRQCSGTLAEPAEHGFGPTFLSGSEGFSGPGGNGNADSRIWAINPLGAKNTAKSLPALGVWSTENAVPLPKTAYNGKTAQRLPHRCLARKPFNVSIKCAYHEWTQRLPISANS
jgi:hypothetical protein